MKALKITLIIIGSLLLLVAGLYSYLYLAHAPTTEPHVQLDVLNDSGEVLYDSYGIPHIYSNNKEDAFKILGYTHAKDRLFQMDVLRRVGGGRLSELFGDDVIPIDRLFRTLGTEQIAQASEKEFMTTGNEEWQRLARAYKDGINDYINSGEVPVEYTILGLEPEPFEIIDQYRTAAYMSFSFAMALKTDPIANKLHQLGPEYIKEIALHSEKWHETIPITNASNTAQVELISSALHDALNTINLPLFEGSNSWVLSPQKSSSGKVLFANDTHIGYAQPSVWYEAHVEAEGLRLYGNFLAGFPYPLIGHTTHHAWGLTMFENDDMDLYQEKIEGNQVWYKGSPVTMTSRTETVKSSSGKEVEFTVNSTPHGPIINGIVPDLGMQDSVSCYWTLTKFPMEFLQLAHGFFKAESIQEFEENLPRLAAPGLNIMYGDAEGNIAWWASAKLIKRPEHVNAKLILDGASGKDDPLGFYSFDANPKAVNPASGFVYSANNAPGLVDSTYIPGYYYEGERARIISAQLKAKDKWSPEEVKQLQMHNTSTKYPRVLSYLLPHIKANDSFEEEVLDLLHNWKGEHQLESSAPAAYYQLVFQVLKHTMNDEMSDTEFDDFMHSFLYLNTVDKLLRTENSAWWDNTSTDEVESKSAIVQAAFEEACVALSTRLGSNTSSWKWQDVHQVTHEHPLGKVMFLDQLFNVGPLVIDGGEEVPNKQAFWITDGVSYPVKSGPAMRIVIDFADVENSWSILPTGQSGNPFSTHYDDQAELFTKGLYRPQHMNRALIEKDLSRKVEFMTKP